jgi:D-xylulose reductase
VSVDIQQEKLDFAKSFAATHTFIPSRPSGDETGMAAAERNAKELIAQLGEDMVEADGADLVLECTGATPCVQMGIFCTKPKGRFVQVSATRAELSARTG